MSSLAGRQGPPTKASSGKSAWPARTGCCCTPTHGLFRGAQQADRRRHALLHDAPTSRDSRAAPKAVALVVPVDAGSLHETSGRPLPYRAGSFFVCWCRDLAVRKLHCRTLPTVRPRSCICPPNANSKILHNASQYQLVRPRYCTCPPDSNSSFAPKICVDQSCSLLIVHPSLFVFLLSLSLSLSLFSLSLSISPSRSTFFPFPALLVASTREEVEEKWNGSEKRVAKYMYTKNPFPFIVRKTVRLRFRSMR
jgi:hypothetical protein